MDKKNSSIQILLVLTFISSYFPYVIGFYGTPLVYLAVIPVILLVFVALITNMKIVVNNSLSKLLLLFFVMNTYILLVGVGFGSYDMFFNFARYTIIGIAYLLVLARIFLRNTMRISKIAINVSALFALLGFLSLIFGDFNFGFIEVNKYYDFYFFGVKLPSTSSIIWNTNYYGISQLIGLIFGFNYLKNEESRKKKFTYLKILIVTVSIVLSGSRSSTYVMILIFLYKFVKHSYVKKDSRKKTILIFMVTALIISSIPILGKAINEFVYTNVMNKGLNGRDIIFQSVVNMSKDRIWGYGYSSSALQERLLKYSNFTGTTQSTYLLYLLRGGFVALGIFVLMQIYTFIAYKKKSKRISSCSLETYFLLFITISIDSLVRSYSLGGSGLMTMLFSISMGVMFLNEEEFA